MRILYRELVQFDRHAFASYSMEISSIYTVDAMFMPYCGGHVEAVDGELK